VSPSRAAATAVLTSLKDGLPALITAPSTWPKTVESILTTSPPRRTPNTNVSLLEIMLHRACRANCAYSKKIKFCLKNKRTPPHLPVRQPRKEIPLRVESLDSPEQ